MSRAQIRITAPPAGWPFHPREHSSPTVCPDLDLRVQPVFAAQARCLPAPPLPREAPREPAASRVPHDTPAVGCGGGRPFRGLHSTCILVPPPGMPSSTRVTHLAFPSVLAPGNVLSLVFSLECLFRLRVEGYSHGYRSLDVLTFS